MNLHDHDININNIMLNFTKYKICNKMVMHKHELNKEKRISIISILDELTLIT
jgi:hypothetical protein